MYYNIILEIKQGNLDVLDKVYLDYKSKFFSFAKKRYPSINIEEIEDIYQDTIIVFYQNIRRGVLTEIKTSISAYIIQVGKIKLIKYLKEQNKLREQHGYYSELQKKEIEYDLRIDKSVKFIFSKMSDSCKEILDLFYYQKKSMQEIASILNYKNADTVKSKKSRCITTFNSNVNKIYFDEE